MPFILLFKPDIGFIVLFYDSSFRFASHIIGQSVPTSRKVGYLFCVFPIMCQKCGEIKMKDNTLCWLSSCWFPAPVNLGSWRRAHFPQAPVSAKQQK